MASVAAQASPPYLLSQSSECIAGAAVTAVARTVLVQFTGQIVLTLFRGRKAIAPFNGPIAIAKHIKKHKGFHVIIEMGQSEAQAFPS